MVGIQLDFFLGGGGGEREVGVDCLFLLAQMVSNSVRPHESPHFNTSALKFRVGRKARIVERCTWRAGSTEERFVQPQSKVPPVWDNYRDSLCGLSVVAILPHHRTFSAQ